MKAKLISREHGEFVFGEQATIGRSSRCTVTLDSTVVSGEHARISFDSERLAYVLEDLGSLNGTLLDGIRVERRELLAKLHVIRFGDSDDFIFQLLTTEEGSELDTIEVPPFGKTQVGEEVPTLPAALQDQPAGSADAAGSVPAPGGTQVEQGVVPVPDIAEAEPLAKAGTGGKAAVPPAPKGAKAAQAAKAPEAPAGATFALEFLLENRPQLFLLGEGENVVGRSKSADIKLGYPDLSRRHATLTVTGGKVVVRDEGSRNRTFLEGQRVESDVPVRLGAKILFGRLEARLIEAPPDDTIAETRRQPR